MCTRPVRRNNKMTFEQEIQQFTGTEQYYKGFMGVLRTDGVQFFTSKASWAITDIEAIVKSHPKVRTEEFVSITIVSKNKKATAEYTDGNDGKLYTQNYGYTSLEEGTYKFYFTDNVLMLSGEY